MKRGYRILIVALVAIGTNFGLHAAFGWCGNTHWRHHHQNGHGHHGGCGEHYNYNGHHGYQDGCANPYNCEHNANSNVLKDSLEKK